MQKAAHNSGRIGGEGGQHDKSLRQTNSLENYSKLSSCHPHSQKSCTQYSNGAKTTESGQRTPAIAEFLLKIIVVSDI